MIARTKPYILNASAFCKFETFKVIQHWSDRSTLLAVESVPSKTQGGAKPRRKGGAG